MQTPCPKSLFMNYAMVSFKLCVCDNALSDVNDLAKRISFVCRVIFDFINKTINNINHKHSVIYHFQIPAARPRRGLASAMQAKRAPHSSHQIILDSLNTVEDTKGNNGKVGTSPHTSHTYDECMQSLSSHHHISKAKCAIFQWHILTRRFRRDAGDQSTPHLVRPQQEQDQPMYAHGP